jgi:hypothetical protein
VALYAHDFAQEFLGRNRRIGIGHGITSGEQMPFSAHLQLSQNPMNEKPSFPGKQHHVSCLNQIEGLPLDGEEIARPERRKHAVAESCEAQTSCGS